MSRKVLKRSRFQKNFSETLIERKISGPICHALHLRKIKAEGGRSVSLGELEVKDITKRLPS